MKKLLFFAVLLLGFAACEDKEEVVAPNDKPQMTELEQTAYQMEVILKSYSDYDTARVGEFLSDKAWEMWSYLKYDSSWSELLFDYYAFGKMNAEGLSPDSYQLNPDGTGSYSHVVSSFEWTTDEGEWSFDPATKRLTLLDNTFYLEAVSPEVMVLQEVIEYLGAEPAYIRLVYIVQ